MSMSNNSDMCTTTVFHSCSSGNHSFEDGNAMECNFWANLDDGSPPTVSTLVYPCPGGLGESGSGTGGGGGIYTGSNNSGSGGFHSGNDSGFPSVPLVKGGSSDFDLDDCVQNIDCEDCNLQGDIDNNCFIDDYEACLLSGITMRTCREDFLDQALEDNPFFLIDIDCNQLPNWQVLAQHKAPAGVLTKIHNLPSSLTNDFEIQTLSEANGTAVNLDYFSVKVTTLPNNPATNSPFTADEMLDYMRLNFNDFVDGSTFEPYCEIASMCQTETDLWNSNNPVGSIIYIDIPGDDGVVVCTKYTNNFWYFMTMNAPYAGNHPVSGTRQFGYEQNLDGSYNFFVRGVDRIDSNAIENTIYAVEAIFGDDDEPNVFSGADDLWESFQTKTRDFINNNGGNSTIVTATKNRPDWDEVEGFLNGTQPISDLGCNNN